MFIRDLSNLLFVKKVFVEVFEKIFKIKHFCSFGVAEFNSYIRFGGYARPKLARERKFLQKKLSILCIYTF